MHVATVYVAINEKRSYICIQFLKLDMYADCLHAVMSLEPLHRH